MYCSALPLSSARSQSDWNDAVVSPYRTTDCSTPATNRRVVAAEMSFERSPDIRPTAA